RGVEHRFPVYACRLTPSIFQGVHFSVENGAAALDTTVVAATKDAVLVYEDRPYRYTAFGQPKTGFLQCCLKKESMMCSFQRVLVLIIGPPGRFSQQKSPTKA